MLFNFMYGRVDKFAAKGPVANLQFSYLEVSLFKVEFANHLGYKID